MTSLTTLIKASIFALLITGVSPPVQAGGEDLRHFMFIGEPNAAAWQYLIDNPADRKAEVEQAFIALGGEVLSYYFGLGDGKNYITVTIPNDNELIQAIYLMRLPSGLLKSYRIVELMPSDQMSEALIRSKMLIEGDNSVKRQ